MKKQNRGKIQLRLGAGSCSECGEHLGTTLYAHKNHKCFKKQKNKKKK